MTTGAAPPETAAVELPLFPLHTVLLPGGALHLQIFEPRYLDMVGRCMRAGTAFGVVRIVAGLEAGPVSDTAAVGTSARIVDFHSLSNGLLGIRCRGERRFRLQSRERRADGLIVGQVRWLPQSTAVPVPAHCRELVSVLRRGLQNAADAAGEHDFADAEWVGYRLLELLPLSAEQRQYSLENHEPLQRLQWLASMVTKPG
jgi:uncharacterized protein